MEIHFHLRSLEAARLRQPGEGQNYRISSSRSDYSLILSSKDTKAAQEEVAFENARALTTALHNTPESREDVVQRAMELVGDVNYPPPETIRMISHLLAIRMEEEQP